MAEIFTRKQIQVSFALSQGDFIGQSGNVVSLLYHRVMCEIKKDGNPSKNEAAIRIFGIKEDLADQLVRDPFSPLANRKTYVQIRAGDYTDPKPPIAFQGEVTDAFVAHKAPPEQYFSVKAVEGYYPSLAPSKTRSYKGTVPAATIFGDLALEMGYFFEPNDTSSCMVTNPYLYGSAYSQATELAETLNLEFGIENGIMFVAKRNQPRVQVGPTPIISPSTGMIEYPTLNKKGLTVQSVFLPGLRLGGSVQISGSVIARANHVWRITSIHHQIESENPHGKWQTTVKSAANTDTQGQATGLSEAE